ncbi:acyltransferase [filamentous cyanobacterium LEGE 11480]|uniref:Acyltransferase n=1 Tax=Romeriopsis navalis LEGE 11480 TaxID=2777977 RepID=A0A928VL28_9CYAN|nr:acyltransferase [Romeriopsis navalis]MBE9030285.1 acyltransferase [Romeriopsis navalis LEGE 11480]
MGQRVRYLDNLRATATILLLPYHAARIFDWVPYYLKAARLDGFELFCRFVDVWFMPLFFVIAGAAASFSLRQRSATQFIFERLQRLMPPFILVGLFLMPLNGYFAYRHQKQAQLSFLQYLPTFLELDPKDLAGFNGGFAFGHLWFLLYLMAFSILMIVLRFCVFQPLSKQLGKAPQSIIVMGFTLGVPLLLSAARSLRWAYPSLVYFAPFYGLGFVLFQTKSQRIVFQYFGPFLGGLGMISMPIVLGLRFWQPELSGDIWYESLRSLNAFFWTIGLLYLGEKFFDRTSRILDWVNQYGLSVYVLHIPIMTGIGYLTLPHIKNAFLAWLVISLLSTIATLLGAVLVNQTWLNMRLWLAHQSRWYR